MSSTRPAWSTSTQIRAVVDSVGIPVNVLARPDGPTVAELAGVGVRRVSTGGALARAAYGALMVGARELLDAGHVDLRRSGSLESGSCRRRSDRRSSPLSRRDRRRSRRLLRAARRTSATRTSNWDRSGRSARRPSRSGRRWRWRRAGDPRGVIAASVVRPSVGWGTRRTSRSASRRSITFVTLAGWTWSRSPILPSGSAPVRVKASRRSASKRAKVRSNGAEHVVDAGEEDLLDAHDRRHERHPVGRLRPPGRRASCGGPRRSGRTGASAVAATRRSLPSAASLGLGGRARKF